MKKTIILLSVFVCLVLAGDVVLYLLTHHQATAGDNINVIGNLPDDFRAINQTNSITNQVNLTKISECSSLPTATHTITLDVLKSKVSMGSVSFSAGNTNKKIVPPNLTDAETGSILAAIQPHIRAVKGYAYKQAEVTISPLGTTEPVAQLEVYVRVSTGQKNLNQFSDVIGKDEYQNLYDFMSAAFDDFSFIVDFNPVTRQIGNVKQGSFVGWDVPDALNACALALLEKNENIIAFRNQNKDAIVGLLGWDFQGYENEYTSDKLIATAYSPSVDVTFATSFDYFVIDPWNQEVVKETETTDLPGSR